MLQTFTQRQHQLYQDHREFDKSVYLTANVPYRALHVLYNTQRLYTHTASHARPRVTHYGIMILSWAHLRHRFPRRGRDQVSLARIATTLSADTPRDVGHTARHIATLVAADSRLPF